MRVHRTRPRNDALDDAPGQQLLFDADVRCHRCGRRLTDDRSRARGFGPGCFRAVCREERGEEDINAEFEAGV
jgi:hypothetical protein